MKKLIQIQKINNRILFAVIFIFLGFLLGRFVPILQLEYYNKIPYSFILFSGLIMLQLLLALLLKFRLSKMSNDNYKSITTYKSTNVEKYKYKSGT